MISARARTARWRMPPDRWWGVFIENLAGRRQPHLFHDLDHRLAALGGTAFNMNLMGMSDLVANLHSWIERSIRVLKYDLHPASELSQFLAAQRRNFLTIEVDLTVSRLKQAQNQAADRRFAAATFTCQSSPRASSKETPSTARTYIDFLDNS